MKSNGWQGCNDSISFEARKVVTCDPGLNVNLFRTFGLSFMVTGGRERYCHKCSGDCTDGWLYLK